LNGASTCRPRWRAWTPPRGGGELLRRVAGHVVIWLTVIACDVREAAAWPRFQCGEI
jgi:hypothetical protein